MNYQYFISAWIYKVLKEADAEYATFLHEQGYGKDENHLYKLFCFGRLNFGKPKLWKEKNLFQIFNDEIYLKIAFEINETATNFIKGIFKDQEFYLGDKFNGIDFNVSSVEVLPEPDFSTMEKSVVDYFGGNASVSENHSEATNFISTVKYINVTPWVVSYKEETDKYAKYLRPDNPMFVQCAIKHLTEKYNNLHDSQVSASEISIDVSPEYKRSGFLIKPGCNDETRIVGVICDFTLTAPVEIHKMIWNAGLCEKSSLGFGWVEVEKE